MYLQFMSLKFQLICKPIVTSAFLNQVLFLLREFEFSRPKCSKFDITATAANLAKFFVYNFLANTPLI